MSVNGHDAEDGSASNTIVKRLLIYCAFIVGQAKKKGGGASLLLTLVSDIWRFLLPFVRLINLGLSVSYDIAKEP